MFQQTDPQAAALRSVLTHFCSQELTLLHGLGFGLVAPDGFGEGPAGFTGYGVGSNTAHAGGAFS